MEILLLLVVIVGFVANFLATRLLLKRVSDKVSFVRAGFAEEKEVTSTTTSSSTFPSNVAGVSGSQLFNRPFDKPAKNDVMEQDLNDVEFSEQSFSNFPSDLKLEVEGGDAAIPPGFDAKK